MSTAIALESRCRFCGAEIDHQVGSPGRPRVYCSRRCRRDWHTLKERYQQLSEAEEAHEERYYLQTRQWWDKPTCDRRARERREEQGARERERERHLEAPWRADD